MMGKSALCILLILTLVFPISVVYGQGGNSGMALPIAIPKSALAPSSSQSSSQQQTVTPPPITLQNGAYYHWHLDKLTWNNLVLTITDTGTLDDVNMHVAFLWDAGNGYMWGSLHDYGPFTITSGNSQTITMSLDTPPADKWTRYDLRVWGDDFNVKDWYGNWAYRTCGGAHMSFSIPTYMRYAQVYIDGANYGTFSGWHSYLVNQGAHNWDLIGYYYNGDWYHWYGSGTTYDCYPYSFRGG